MLRLPQSTVSRHLKALGDVGWVTSRREGTSRSTASSRRRSPESARGLWHLVRDEVGPAPGAAARRSPAGPRARARRAAVAGLLLRRRRASGTACATSCSAPRRRPGAPRPARPDWWSADLGCGTGHVASLVAPFVRRVVGVDASAAMLAAAERSCPSTSTCARARSRRCRSATRVDLALLVLVLHHVPDPARALAEAARVLKPGGRLVVVDMQPHDREDYRQRMGHVWLGFGDPVHRLLQAAASMPCASCRWSRASAEGPSLFLASAASPSPLTSESQGDR